MNLKIVHTSNKEVENTPPKKINPKYIGKKMKRNEPCFCGSNKKYKHCCGAL
jgi:preprotein translocase subunit SecA